MWMSKPKKEVSLSVYRTLEVKVAKLSTTNKELRCELRAAKKKIKRIDSSRVNWRDKAVSRREGQDKLKRQLKGQNEAHYPKRHQYPTWVINLVIVLRIYCNCSYGSLPKILEVLQKEYLYCASELKVPNKKTMQNWVSKVGYFYIKQIDKELVGEELCLIMDESVRLGTEKLFLALVCPYQKWLEGNLRADQVRVIYVSGRSSWTGDKIAIELNKVIKENDLRIKYVLSDEGTNLKRATRLLKLPHIADISHLIATCLKKNFQNREDYKAFVKTVGQCSTKLSMGVYSFLRPYKQRVKARFLNQGKTVNWATIILEKWSSLDKEAQAKLSALPDHKAIIELLGTVLDLARQVAKILKNSGLNQQTIQQTMQLVDEVIEDSTADEVVKTFAKHLQSYLVKYDEFINLEAWKGQTIPVCSDVIERLFGRFKAKVGDNHFVTASTISLELPLMCLDKEELTKKIKTALETIFMSDLKVWKQKQSTDNQSGKRAKFFKK